MEIHWVNLPELEPALREAAEVRLQQLADGHDDLIDVRIVLQATRHHRHGARAVHMKCLARGQQIVAIRERDEFGLALNEVLDDFEREVLKLRDRRRDRRMQRPAVPPRLGLIDRLFADDGYGFVLMDDGTQVYFHRNAVHGGLRFDALEEGQRVGLDVEAGDKGPQATTIVPIPPGIPAP